MVQEYLIKSLPCRGTIDALFVRVDATLLRVTSFVTTGEPHAHPVIQLPNDDNRHRNSQYQHSWLALRFTSAWLVWMLIIFPTEIIRTADVSMLRCSSQRKQEPEMRLSHAWVVAHR